MIQSFKNKRTQDLFEGVRIRKFSSKIQERATRKLRMVDAATTVEDLRVPPSNCLEKLSGGRDGQWSIRINRQWRICFNWESDGPHNVEVVDYH